MSACGVKTIARTRELRPRAPRRVRFKDNTSVPSSRREALLGDWRTGHVPAEALETDTVMGGDVHVGVQFEARRATSAQRLWGSLRAPLVGG